MLPDAGGRSTLQRWCRDHTVQMEGPATGKAWPPRVDSLTDGISRRLVPAERNRQSERRQSATAAEFGRTMITMITSCHANGSQRPHRHANNAEYSITTAGTPEYVSPKVPLPIAPMVLWGPHKSTTRHLDRFIRFRRAHAIHSKVTNSYPKLTNANGQNE